MAESIIKFLSETHYKLEEPEVDQLRWMEEIEGAQSFFIWLNQIGKENFISSEELETYNYLANNDKLVPDNQLDSELEKFMLPEEDSQHFDYDANQLKAIIQASESEFLQLNSSHQSLRNELKIFSMLVPMSTKSEIRLKRQLDKFYLLNEKYKREIIGLQNEINGFYRRRLSSSEKKRKQQLLHEKSFDKFFDILDITKLTLNSSVTKFFKHLTDESNNIVLNSDRKKSIEYHFNRVSDDIIRLELDAAKAKAECESIEAVCKFVYNYSQQSDKSLFDFVSNEAAEHDESLLALDEEELERTCEIYVKKLFEIKHMDNIQEQKEWLTNIRDKLQEFCSLARPLKLYYAVVVVLLRQQLNWIKVCSYFLKDTRKVVKEELNEINSRKAWYNRLIMQQDIAMPHSFSVQSTVLSDCSKIINSMDLLNCTQLSEIACPVTLDKALDGSLANMVTRISEDVLSLITNVNVILSFMNEFDTFLFEGPTRMHRVNPKLIQKVNQCLDDLRTIKSNNKKIEEHYASLNTLVGADTYKRIINKLWTDYSSVIPDLLEFADCISNVQQHHTVC